LLALSKKNMFFQESVWGKNVHSIRKTDRY